MGRRSLFFQLLNAVAADQAVHVVDQILVRAAEDAAVFDLAQADDVVLHENFNVGPLGHVQAAAQLNGDHDAAELVHLTNNASRFHCYFSPSCRYKTAKNVGTEIIIVKWGRFVNFFK